MTADLTRDLRRSDVEEAERLFALADRNGTTPLPSLLMVDLCLFGGYKQALFDESALGTWAALTGEAREEFGGEALTELVQRGLLSREPGRGYGAQSDDAPTTTRYRLHPALAMILSTRAHPVWLAVCTLADSALTGPRMYGLGSVPEPRRAAVIEMPREEPPTEPTAPDLADLGKIYDYTLASTEKAADLLAEWATLPVADGDVSRRRQVDVYHHPQGGPLSRVRLAVEGDEHRATLTVGEPGAAEEVGDYDRSALAYYLLNVIRRFS